jgi:hypothetical protein
MTASRRFSLRLAGGVLAGALVVATALHATMAAPSDLDLSRTRVTAGGGYRVSFTPEGDSIRVGRMHAWRLHVETVGVTQALGGGDYLVSGMKFNMRGWWIVSFKLQQAGAADSVTFNLKL